MDDPNVPASIQADANGTIMLSELPSTGVSLSIRPFDNNGDGMPEFRTTTRSIDLLPNTTLKQSIVLQENTGVVEVVQTNLPTSNNDPVYDLPLFLLFSTGMDMNGELTYVTLIKEYPFQEIPVTPIWISETHLDISVPKHQLDDSGVYKLEVKATSNGGVIFEKNWDLNFDLQSQIVCEEVINDLCLSSANEEIDYTTTDLTVEWTAIACSGGYKVYAKDDYNNPDWVFLKEEPTDYEFGTIRTTVSLPSQFDRYEVDNLQTPFAGITVFLCVVPINALISTPGNTHAVLELADNTAPVIEEVTQLGFGNNNTGVTRSLSFYVQFSEYIDPNVMDPIITFTEAGGDPNFVLSSSQESWQWVWAENQADSHFRWLKGKMEVVIIIKSK
ncbi:MAG: hypothetical protein ACMUJM_01545 [bacterium]